MTLILFCCSLDVITNKMNTDHGTPKETIRLEAFSDGVFAIAITLLVLDIHVPEVKGNESLLQPILNQWPNYLAFLIGFFTILVCWINHHCMFDYIHKTDGTLLLLNGFKLLMVSFTPFATSILSKYIGTAHQQTAVSLYAFSFFLMGFAMTLIWDYARHKGLMKPVSEENLKAATRLYRLASIFSAMIFLASFVTTLGALMLSLVMFLLFMFPRKSIHFFIKRTAVSA